MSPAAKEEVPHGLGPGDHVLRVVFTDLDGTCVHYPGIRYLRDERGGVCGGVENGSGGEQDPHTRTTRAKLSLELKPCDDKDSDINDWAVEKARLGKVNARVTYEVQTPHRHECAYACSQRDVRYELLALPESSSGSRGFISLEALRLYQRIRDMGLFLVVISGCRYSTLLERLPFIPEADVYACESGGRIFYKEQGMLMEDLGWKRRMAEQVKELGRCKVSFKDRFRAGLEGGSIKLDDRSYTTAFRVRRVAGGGQHGDSGSGSEYSEASFARYVREWVDEGWAGVLSTTTNLGSVDIFPARSGKKNAAAYLADRTGGWELGRHAAFLCDDDNDIELASCANKVYLPGMSDGMREKVANDVLEDGVAARNKYRFMRDGRIGSFCVEPFRHTEFLLGALALEIGNRVKAYCDGCGGIILHNASHHTCHGEETGPKYAP